MIAGTDTKRATAPSVTIRAEQPSQTVASEWEPLSTEGIGTEENQMVVVTPGMAQTG